MRSAGKMVSRLTDDRSLTDAARKRTGRSVLLALFSAASLFGTTFSFHIAGDGPAPWAAILGSVGLSAGANGPTNLFVLRGGAPGTVEQWMEKIDKGAVVVVEGESELGAALGIHAT